MTNPVILLGTQSNGETLPVQVDDTGRLVAEGLQGLEGQQGPAGPPGGSFPLPDDPYEGALLGWLDGELAWIGSPPVPIPEGVFGPITAFDPVSGMITVEGSIPDSVGSGVYIYQVTETGDPFTATWNVSRTWSDATETGGSTFTLQNLFNTVQSTESGGHWGLTSPNTEATVEFDPPLPAGSSVKIWGYLNANVGSGAVYVNGTDLTSLFPGSYEAATWCDVTSTAFGGISSLKIVRSTAHPCLGGIAVDNLLLVDTQFSLNMRVNQVLGTNNIIGVGSVPIAFTPGAYLKVPSQRVAPWVLYGNDPTSLIDHLRRTRD